MRHPVNQPDFWKDRLREAKQRGVLHYAVFVANSKLWDVINKKHRSVLSREIGPNDKVLDAGCGYGRSSEMIESTHYLGVDFSEDFINEATRLYPDREFMIADLKRLPFKDSEFDVAFCVSVKHMIQANLGESAWEDMERELRRVAKKVLVLEYGTGDLGIEEDADNYEIL